MVVDRYSREITVGSHVRYINTGTTGEVVDIKEKDCHVWVLLDNELMYRPEYLEVIKYKEHSNKKDIIDEEYIEKIVDNEKLSDIDIDVDAAGAG